MFEVQRDIEEATAILATYIKGEGCILGIYKKPGSSRVKEIYVGSKLLVSLQDLGDGESRLTAAEKQLEDKIKEIFADDIVVLGTA